MNSAEPRNEQPLGNPFSTRFIRPDAAEFLFESDASAETLIARLRENHWRGEIIGPHGTGKSTLLATLLPLLAAEGREVMRTVLQVGSAVLPEEMRNPSAWTERTQLVIDGFEQLSWWQRTTLIRRCRSSQAGLLITAHAPLGLPTLFETQATLESARRIVTRLTGGEAVIDDEDIRRKFEQCGGNLREMLFQLYDVFEARDHERRAVR